MPVFLARLQVHTRLRSEPLADNSAVPSSWMDYKPEEKPAGGQKGRLPRRGPCGW